MNGTADGWRRDDGAVATDGVVVVARASAVLVPAAGRVTTAEGACDGVRIAWHRALYVSSPTVTDVPGGPALATRAAELPCNDTLGRPAPAKPKPTLIVHRVPGVPTAAALLLADDRRTLSLAPGFFPDVPSHPAYRYLEHVTPTADGWSCEAARHTLGGKSGVVARGRVPLSVKSAPWLRGVIHDGLVVGRVDARTDLSGLRRRAGLPFARNGERLEAVVSVCRSGGRPIGLLIRSLRHAPRVRLKVKVQVPGATRSRSFRVECGPVAGGALDPAAACRAVDADPRLTKNPSFYEGPSIPDDSYWVVVTGRVEDRSISVAIDGCGLPGHGPALRWARLTGVARAPS